MAKMAHNGGLVETVLELGFDVVKYFEGDITASPVGFDIAPPARRLTLTNTSTAGNLFFRIDGSPAAPSVSFVPGDNVKIGPGLTFTMDFDILETISFVSDGGTVQVEGVLGWKGIRGNDGRS